MKHKDETGVHIVLPHWWQDCISTHSRLPEGPYEYPDPFVLSGKQLERGANPPDWEKMHLFRGLTEDLRGGRVEKIVPASQVWHGRSIYLSPSLELSEATLQSLKNDIRTGNGAIAKSVLTASVFVTRYREGKDYETAHKLSKTIGNLEWVRHVHRIGNFTSPTDQLLHYPIPSTPIPTFSKHVSCSCASQFDADKWFI